MILRDDYWTNYPDDAATYELDHAADEEPDWLYKYEDEMYGPRWSE